MAGKHMDKLNKEYIEILTEMGIRQISFGSWKRIKEDEKDCGAM